MATTKVAWNVTLREISSSSGLTNKTTSLNSSASVPTQNSSGNKIHNTPFQTRQQYFVQKINTKQERKQISLLCFFYNHQSLKHNFHGFITNRHDIQPFRKCNLLLTSTAYTAIDYHSLRIDYTNKFTGLAAYCNSIICFHHTFIQQYTLNSRCGINFYDTSSRITAICRHCNNYCSPII